MEEIASKLSTLHSYSPKRLSSIQGMVDFVCRFIKDYADIIASLEPSRRNHANERHFQNAWGMEQYTALAHIRRVLRSAPVLNIRKWSRFLIHGDLYDLVAGGFSANTSGDISQPADIDIIAYFSKRMSPSLYSRKMKQCYGFDWFPLHWGAYLRGRHFTCWGKHQALTHLCYMQDASNMSTQRSTQSQSVNYTPRILHVVPDALSRLFGDTNIEGIPP